MFAVDCFGHGESSHDPALYSCEAIGRAFKSFAAQKIGACYLVSGHSSGGIIAAWLDVYKRQPFNRLEVVILVEPADDGASGSVREARDGSSDIAR